jgi:hypothetical protein
MWTRAQQNQANKKYMRRKRRDPVFCAEQVRKVQAYQAKNQGKVRKWKKDYDLKQYGLTESTYDALVVGQQGRCRICGRLPGGKGHCKRLFVDHDHSTGKVRGLLCVNCNYMLGHSGDDPNRLRAAADYLEAI